LVDDLPVFEPFLFELRILKRDIGRMTQAFITALRQHNRRTKILDLSKPQ
jgi:hypothetical protein